MINNLLKLREFASVLLRKRESGEKGEKRRMLKKYDGMKYGWLRDAKKYIFIITFNKNLIDNRSEKTYNNVIKNVEISST